MESRTLPTVHLEQMAEWEAWLQSSECAELLQGDGAIDGLKMIKPNSVVQLEHYATRLD